MKKNYSLFLIISFQFLIINCCYAQPPGEWMWIHGSNTINNPGNFGTQGIPSPANNPPGLYEACEWTDLNGNFWLFGGTGFMGIYGALWKYNPTTNEWTWMKGSSTAYYPGDYGTQGIPSPTNNPKSTGHGAASWVDVQGNLWMFGGQGGSAALWKYDVAANVWTWMKGPSDSAPGVYGTQQVPDTANYPGNRTEGASAWTDNSGNLWLFGGSSRNDLWRYNIAANIWTWMKGSSATLSDSSHYGTQGVEAPDNKPGGRNSYSHWKDNYGNLWLFGGAVGANDLWRFNPATNNWTWMKGSSYTISAPAYYGISCVPSALNEPSGRFENRAVWTDDNGNFWMFGGAALGNFNDLWMYCVATNKWMWVSGDSATSSQGNWGTMGVPSPDNIPNGRRGAVGWFDHNGHLYLFGGNFNFAHDDLWKYTIDSLCGTCLPSPLPTLSVSGYSVVCSGGCSNLEAIPDGDNPPYTYAWSPNIGTGEGPHQVCPDSTTTYAVTITDADGNTSSATYTVTVITNQTSQIIISNNYSNATCGNNNGSITPTYSGGNHPYTFLWNTSPPQTYAQLYNLAPGNYTVSVNDATGCTASASFTIIATPSPVVNVTGDTTICYTEEGITLAANGAITYVWSPSTALNHTTGSNVIANSLVTTTYIVIGTTTPGCRDTAYVTVTVHPTPNMVVSPISPVLCQGEQVELSVSGGLNYHWSPQDGLSNPNGPDSSTIISTPSATTVYSITAYSPEGCPLTIYANVAVRYNPVISVGSIGPTEFCEGNSVYFYATLSGEYLWSTGDTTPAIQVSTNGTYFVSMTDAYGCTGFSPPVTTTVYPNPAPIITPSGPTELCYGDSVELITSSPGTYLWSSGEITQSIYAHYGGLYLVTVTGNHNCSGTASQSITVHPPLFATISPDGSTEFCLGNSVTLYVYAINAINYLWSDNSTQNFITVNSAGTYTVTVTDNFSCTKSASISVTVYPAPPSVNISATPSAGCRNNLIYTGYGSQTITLTADAPEATSFLWSTGELTQSIFVTTAGTYSVTAYDMNGCASLQTSQSQFTIDAVDIRCGNDLKKIILCHVPNGNPENPQTICISPLAIPPHLALHPGDCLGPCSLYFGNRGTETETENFYVYPYPNPFNNGFNLNILSSENSAVTVNVHDMLGRIVETYNDVTEQTVIGTKLNTGIYFAEVIQGNNRQRVQIVKAE